jgi:hypothetical protein
MPRSVRFVVAITAASMLTLVTQVRPCLAQNDEGFGSPPPPAITGPEFAAQEDVWVIETSFKSLRLISVDLTDPQTGEKSRQLVRYLPFRIVNRQLLRPVDETDRTPINQYDQRPSPPVFIPQFTLVTNDNLRQEIYQDVVLPEAQAAINRREGRQYLNTIEIAGELPAETALDAKEGDVHAVYGVATFLNVDPEADFFTIFATGFSNAYQATPAAGGPDAKSIRTIVIDYARPGDRFAVGEHEFKPTSAPRWIYRPAGPVQLPLDGAPAGATPAGDAPPAEPTPPAAEPNP